MRDIRLGSDWSPETGLLTALPVAIVAALPTGEIRHVNPAAERLFAVVGADITGGDLAGTLFAEPEQGAVREILSQVEQGHPWEGELVVPGGAGSLRRLALTVTSVREGGRVVGSLLTAEEVAGETDSRLTERLARLARVTTELLLAEDLAAVTETVVEHLADAAGATVASLSLLVDPTTLRLIGIRGGRSGVASRWQTYAVDDSTPAGEAVRTGAAVVLSGRADIESRYPGLETAADGERALVCLPLRVGTRPLGVTSLSFPGRRCFDPTELEFYGILADTCAQAIDRMQALAEAADQASKLRFLADASIELARDLDYEATLGKVARLAVPWFADWCAISLEQDGHLRTLAVAHVDPQKVALAEEYQRAYPPDPASPRGSYEVLRTGRSELTPEISDEMLAAAVRDPDQLAMLRELNFRSGLVVPLKANGRVLGVITWVAGEEGRRFGPRDQEFGEDLGRRAAVAIDNAHLHTEQREMAVRLQRAVLPTGLPSLAGWKVAARYLPAGHNEVGGDFYDVIRLDDERTALFVGDVMGRGVQAAAAMAQMRASVRTLVAVDPDPGSVMSRLDMLFRQYDLSQLVTMVYAVADTTSDTLEVANAGHLPPLILRADGDVEQVSSRDGMLLGADGGPRVCERTTLALGDTLVVFTDGLVERRGEDIDDGVRRLVDALSTLSYGDLEAGLDAVIDTVRDVTKDDDVAILVLRRTQ